MATYLVEHYLPGLDATALEQVAADIRVATEALGREGAGVRYVRSTIVPDDEAFISVFEAVSEESVRAAYARGRVSFDRISTAIEERVATGAEEERR